ncbi:MAG TPA: hypothetical protein VHO84_04955, partial [Syntrophorhabdaceae bacterium]|nr:hypothetical protein [Syntrophorhabdaceae bacterium]
TVVRQNWPYRGGWASQSRDAVELRDDAFTRTVRISYATDSPRRRFPVPLFGWVRFIDMRFGMSYTTPRRC